MQYREMGKTGDMVSILGYGCMRYPAVNGRIDEVRTERQIIQAIELGVNYFDTAYIYLGGKSESVLGEILSKGYRDRVRIADKMPPYLVHSVKDMGKILETQLNRLRTDHIDYYLMHALNSFANWDRLKKLGILEFVDKMKQEGKIVYFGFSFHGDKDDFKAIIDDHPWDFCQIQYNYLDEYFQAGREGLEYAASKGIGVIVMEPLRGGMLVRKMPPDIQKIWDSSEVKRSAADWALRWLWDQPGITTVLSGLNEEAHIDENVKIAGEVRINALLENEQRLYSMVKQEYKRLMKVGCTGCGYCLPCPAGVDIPMCFGYYNSRHLFKAKNARKQYLAFTSAAMGGRPSYASLCKDCGKCEKVCPQHIPIREKLREVAGDMEIPVLKPAMWLARKYFALKGGKKKP